MLDRVMDYIKTLTESISKLADAVRVISINGKLTENKIEKLEKRIAELEAKLQI